MLKSWPFPPMTTPLKTELTIRSLRIERVPKFHSATNILRVLLKISRWSRRKKMRNKNKISKISWIKNLRCRPVSTWARFWILMQARTWVLKTLWRKNVCLFKPKHHRLRDIAPKSETKSTRLLANNSSLSKVLLRDLWKGKNKTM